ncbi:MAG: hypothetical protein HY904_14635 [Deltaproteobacteria bacterium]|nr:hypothetical protein [Deltaproteobacteria bacterium]
MDTCNGIDDDNDQSFDEDGWAVAEVTRNALTTDAPSFVRVSVAAATGGFVAAYSAYCSGNSSDVFVNFIRLDGTYVLATGPCAAVRGRDAYLSPSDRSRHPWITSDGAGRAGLVWTEETLGGAELVAAELALDVNNTTNPVNVVDTLQVRPVHSRFGSVNAYGGVAVAPDGLLTALTGGVDLLDEQVYVQRLTRPGADLVVNGDAQIHPSTEGEATLAALPDGYVVAFTDAYTLYAQALSPSGQPLGTDTLLQVDRGDPLTPWELIALPLEGNRAVISWYEPTDGANWHIRFAVLTLTTRELRLLGGSIPTPADRGYFGAAYVGGDELVVSATSPTTQKLVLYRVDLNTGTTCGSPVTLESATDAGHSAVAFKDGKLLVAWHKGGDQPADQNSVLTVKLDRTGP